jgi:hypothetical protein
MHCHGKLAAHGAKRGKTMSFSAGRKFWFALVASLGAASIGAAAIVAGTVGAAFAQEEGKSPVRMPTLPAVAGARAPAPGTPPGGVLQGPATYDFQQHLLHWPLPAADKKYGAIDGHRIHGYVEDLTAIARKYRDDGHPQFWGRIIGTSADEESASSGGCRSSSGSACRMCICSRSIWRRSGCRNRGVSRPLHPVRP